MRTVYLVLLCLFVQPTLLNAVEQKVSQVEVDQLYVASFSTLITNYKARQGLSPFHPRAENFCIAMRNEHASTFFAPHENIMKALSQQMGTVRSNVTCEDVSPEGLIWIYIIDEEPVRDGNSFIVKGGFYRNSKHYSVDTFTLRYQEERWKVIEHKSNVHMFKENKNRFLGTET